MKNHSAHESLDHEPVAKHSFKDVRLRKHADYQRVYKAARKQFSASMTWFVATRPANPASSEGDQPPSPLPRVGLTVGKVIGKAHERNRIKRRMRELVSRHLSELPLNVDLILHPRRSVMTSDFVKLDAEILRIFRQASSQMRPVSETRGETREKTFPQTDTETKQTSLSRGPQLVL